MIKDALNENESIEANTRQMEVLKEHFPSCFKGDGTFDLGRFKSEIASSTQVVNEGYELRFLGKSYAKLLASTETTTVIKPNEDHNALPENANSQNLYISGDNLDGLKHLLKSYNGAIKCIYIDPPYNTGSDGFVYRDNFEFTADNLQEKLSVSEDEANRILELTKRGSASHSAWLMFMYSRLLLARDLLSAEGVIFISIDDNELANLKLLCDDVFGEEFFVVQLTVLCNPKGRSQDKFFATNHEYLIGYSKSLLQKGAFSIDKTEEQISKEYPEIDEDGFSFRFLELRNTHREFGKHNRKNLYYPFYVDPEDSKVSLTRTSNSEIEVFPLWDDGYEGCWTWDSENAAENLNLLAGRFIIDKWKIYRKSYSEGASKMLKTILNDKSFFTEKGQAEFNALFDTKEKIFQAPKSVELLKTMLATRLDSNDIALDFFSGSGTTAQAIMELNEDGGNRHFIAIQLPEKQNPDIDSQRLAYEFLKKNNLPATLDYIGFERIKRAAEKIKAKNLDKELDLGFRHYTLAEPNPNTLDKLESFDKSALITDTSLLDDFGRPTILATWLCADGYGLSRDAKSIELAGYTAWHCDKHLYLIDQGFSLENMKALIGQYEDGHFQPDNLVLFGYSFPDWSISEMIEKNLRILNETEKNLKINYTVRY